MEPSPNGPPWCGQRLSRAPNSAPTWVSTMLRRPAVTVRTRPAGRSSRSATLCHVLVVAFTSVLSSDPADALHRSTCNAVHAGETVCTWKRRTCRKQWPRSPCGTSRDLRALFINCTLKRSPEVSNTQGLADISMEIMRRQGVTVDVVRAIDHDIATGVWPDMTEHGWERDDWPAIFEQVEAARHPRALHADLAGREVVGVHPDHRAALRQQPPAQRRGAVRGTTGGSVAASSPATRTA